MTLTSEGTTSGVRVYRAADAPDLGESGVASTEFGAQESLREAATTLAGADCSINKLLVHQRRDQGGMSIVYLFFKPNFPLFRHSHDVDSLYVIISGSVVDFMGEETLRPGDCWSVLKGNSYWYKAGPEGVEVLEMFRDADTVKIIMEENPAGRLQEAEAAMRDNMAAWKKITAGALYKANAGGR